MDASFPLAGLIEEFNMLIDAQDYEGAEELLLMHLGSQPRFEPFLHFQMGRMYSEWNKMSSALNHFTKAAELSKAAADELFLLQVLDEIKRARKRQAEQAP